VPSAAAAAFRLSFLGLPQVELPRMKMETRLRKDGDKERKERKKERKKEYN
jgi:hypothetical protein